MTTPKEKAAGDVETLRRLFTEAIEEGNFNGAILRRIVNWPSRESKQHASPNNHHPARKGGLEPSCK